MNVEYILDEILGEDSIDESEKWYFSCSFAYIFDLNKLTIEQRRDLFEYITDDVDVNTEGWRGDNTLRRVVFCDLENIGIRSGDLEFTICCIPGKFNGELWRYMKFQGFDLNSIQVIRDPNF